MRLRLAMVADAEAIGEIYNREVTTDVNTFDLVPRTPAEQRAWIAGHGGAHPAIVAIDAADTIVGFGSLSPYRDRPAYRTTVENSVYVHPDHRGQGAGKALLVELVSLAKGHGFHTIIARIVGHNETSIGLHRACGFDEIGVEREVGRKFGKWLDVVAMQRLLNP